MADERDDEDFERLLDALRRCAEEAQQRAIDGMEEALAEVPGSLYRSVPPPGYCHPALAQQQGFILDWLDGLAFPGQFLNLPVAVPSVRSFIAFNPDAPVEVSPMRVRTMRKQRGVAPAPYVGRPYVYWWWVGIDDHGRAAGSAHTHRAYTDGGPQ